MEGKQGMEELEVVGRDKVVCKPAGSVYPEELKK
jgi:hypothetical protein